MPNTGTFTADNAYLINGEKSEYLGRCPAFHEPIFRFKGKRYTFASARTSLNFLWACRVLAEKVLGINKWG